jgi:hypothetical protein
MKISVITPSIRPTGLNVLQNCLAEQTFTDFEWLVEVGLKKEHDLNKSFNKMIQRAQGELLVFYQDYIKIGPDGLQKFWDAYQDNKNDFITAPVGKVSDFNFTDAKWDWRYYSKGKPITWDKWEIDWGACSKEAMFKIGGFDEYLDNFWSCDNLNAGCRADIDGYTFKCIDNDALAYDHDAHMSHPFRKDFKPIFNNERMDDFRAGERINYLQK